VNNAQLSMLFHSDSTNIARIANWRPGGERALTTACFTYRTFFDPIRTQILNWRNSFGRWNRPKTGVSGAVRVFDVVKPVATVPG